jgi:hypothetical protein
MRIEEGGCYVFYYETILVSLAVKKEPWKRAKQQPSPVSPRDRQPSTFAETLHILVSVWMKKLSSA